MIMLAPSVGWTDIGGARQVRTGGRDLPRWGLHFGAMAQQGFLAAGGNAAIAFPRAAPSGAMQCWFDPFFVEKEDDMRHRFCGRLTLLTAVLALLSLPFAALADCAASGYYSSQNWQGDVYWSGYVDADGNCVYAGTVESTSGFGGTTEIIVGVNQDTNNVAWTFFPEAA